MRQVLTTPILIIISMLCSCSADDSSTSNPAGAGGALAGTGGATAGTGGASTGSGGADAGTGGSAGASGGSAGSTGGSAGSTGGSAGASGTCDQGNLIVESHSSNGAAKKVVVWGLTIYATANVSDAVILHAANVLAQYLDNDENCVIDDANVLAEMPSTALIVGSNEQDTYSIGYDAQPLWQSEVTLPGGNGFDFSLEEVLHVVTGAWAQAYPSDFGSRSGTTLADAMDIARGGHFANPSVPASYPAAAWYHYDDTTCDYGCMADEYIYWALTSLLGAQASRCNQIDNEWELCTAAQVQSTDTAVYALLRSSGYALPTVLPDGSYTPT